jgi:hypothetical protein
VLTLVSTIFPINFRIKLPFSNVDVHFECAGSHKTEAAAGASGMFPVNPGAGAGARVLLVVRHYN